MRLSWFLWKGSFVWSIVLALTVVKYINQEIGTMSFHHVWKFQKLISWTYMTLYRDLYKRKNKVLEIPPGERLVGATSHTRTWELAAEVFVPLLPESAKSSKKFLTASRVWVSAPPLIVHTTQTAFIWEQKVSLVGPHHLPKFLGKKPKPTTQVTLTSHQILQNIR